MRRRSWHRSFGELVEFFAGYYGKGWRRRLVDLGVVPSGRLGVLLGRWRKGTKSLAGTASVQRWVRLMNRHAVACGSRNLLPCPEVESQLGTLRHFGTRAKSDRGVRDSHASVNVNCVNLTHTTSSGLWSLVTDRCSPPLGINSLGGGTALRIVVSSARTVGKRPAAGRVPPRRRSRGTRRGAEPGGRDSLNGRRAELDAYREPKILTAVVVPVILPSPELWATIARTTLTET